MFQLSSMRIDLVADKAEVVSKLHSHSPAGRGLPKVGNDKCAKLNISAARPLANI